jgi:hypothetical protein
MILSYISTSEERGRSYVRASQIIKNKSVGMIMNGGVQDYVA